MRALLTRLLGDKGERYAARFLRRQGFRIIARQYRNQFGEIDLIALDGDQVVFIEVKTRKSDRFGQPAEAVDFAKQKQLTRLALAYLKKHGLLDRSARFDIVGIIWPDGQKHPDVQHFRNAFEGVGQGQMF